MYTPTSVAIAAFDSANHRFTTLMPPDIGQQDLEGGFGLGHCNNVWRQPDTRVLPEWMLGRRRI